MRFNALIPELSVTDIEPFKDIFESAYTSNDKIYRQREILISDSDGYLLRFSQDK